MYLDRLWCSLETVGFAGGGPDIRAVVRGRRVRGRSVVEVATRFIGASVRRPRLALLPKSWVGMIRLNTTTAHRHIMKDEMHRNLGGEAHSGGFES